MGERIDALIGALQCQNTAAQLRADGVLTSSSQAIFWDAKVEERLEPLVEAPARAILAEMFGGAKYGHLPDSPTMNAHVEQNTEQWKLARHYAKTALLNAGLVDADKEEVL